MDVGDWITLGAVIVALSIGVASILHTRSLQKKERKERLLNEIIEWAIKVRKYIYSFDSGGFNSELERSQAKEKIEKSGGKLANSVSRSTDYLLAGKSPGTKLQRANDLGIQIIDESTFIDMVS